MTAGRPRRWRTVAVTDRDDPRVADYRTLKDTELRKRYENQWGVFVAEGPNPVRELLASGYPTRSVLVSDHRLDTVADDLDAHAPDGLEVFVVRRDLLDAIVTFPMHQGVIGCGGRVPRPGAAEVVAGADRVLVLDAMNDHENMGAIFRTARALGADAVLLGPRSADPLYRRCVRVSMGHVLHVPFAQVDALPGGYDVLRSAGLDVVALTPSPDAVAIGQVPTDRPLALVLGAEGPGLDEAAIAGADHRARIPIAPDVDSLNVATSAAVALHAVARA